MTGLELKEKLIAAGWRELTGEDRLHLFMREQRIVAIPFPPPYEDFDPITLRNISKRTHLALES